MTKSLHIHQHVIFTQVYGRSAYKGNIKWLAYLWSQQNISKDKSLLFPTSGDLEELSQQNKCSYEVNKKYSGCLWHYLKEIYKHNAKLILSVNKFLRRKVELGFLNIPQAYQCSLHAQRRSGVL